MCIPVFNGERFLRQTLDSVFAQTFEDFEVVVSDNCSTDGTSALLERYDDRRLRVMRNRENIGAIANWNQVRAEARGAYVKLLPADDVLAPHCLARQVAVLDDPAHAGVVMVAGKRDIVDEDDQVLLRDRGLAGLRGVVRGHDAVRHTVRAGTNVFGEPAAVLVRQEALAQCRPFTSSRPYMVDVELWCEVLSHGDLYALAETVATFRVSGTSESAKEARSQARQAQELFRALHQASPDVVRRRDVLTGAARAVALAHSRRLLYRVLARRAVRASSSDQVSGRH
ncbi:MAG TPA: glycosyltransferase [Acidimicrobiales bacterium]|nr:glycosyltransferase [Acidimicrobiales bacterium]